MPKKKGIKKWQLAMWLPRKRKKRKKKKRKKEQKRGNVTGNINAWKKKCNLKTSSPLNFFSIFWRKHFGGSREKIPKLYYLFSFPPIQPNTLQKSFLSYFLSKVLHTPYFTSKQTHPNSMETFLEVRKKIMHGLFFFFLNHLSLYKFENY